MFCSAHGIGVVSWAGWFVTQASFSRTNPSEHVAHFASPLTGQSVPVAPFPLSQVHCFSVHSRPGNTIEQITLLE